MNHVVIWQACCAYSSSWFAVSQPPCTASIITVFGAPSNLDISCCLYWHPGTIPTHRVGILKNCQQASVLLAAATGQNAAGASSCCSCMKKKPCCSMQGLLSWHCVCVCSNMSYMHAQLPVGHSLVRGPCYAASIMTKDTDNVCMYVYCPGDQLRANRQCSVDARRLDQCTHLHL